MSYYGNMKIPRKHGMDREDEEEMNIYDTDPINSFDVGAETENSDTKRHQTPQHTGSVCVKIRSSRTVCLVLLCVLLLTAVIVLCVHIHTKSTNYTEERDGLLNNITNLTEERDGLLNNITNLTDERDGLLNNITNLTEERDGLLNNITNLTEERDGLLNNITNLTEERDGLLIKNKNLTNERDQLRNHLQSHDGWTYYKSSLYYMPSEKKSWTESRRDCRERGSDLIIINNTEKQDFVKNMYGSAIVWIGLTDSDAEGRWKWVDNSTLTSGFWATDEPNGHTVENCAVNVHHNQRWPALSGWLDIACNSAFKGICEKRTSHIDLMQV